jgi:hypothetical protein
MKKYLFIILVGIAHQKEISIKFIKKIDEEGHNKCIEKNE